MSEQLIKAQDAAELLGISISTIYSLVHRRAIPHYKPTGKLLYFNESELLDWVQSARVETKQGA